MTPNEFPVEPFHSLNEMFSHLEPQEPIEKTLEETIKLAVSGIENCDAGSMSLADDGSVKTLVATGEEVVAADEAQYNSGKGPCVQAIRTGEVYQVDDMAQEERWQEFAAASLEHDFQSSLSVPLKVEAHTIGAFNLYSRTLNAFEEDSRRIASLFASRAAIGIAHAELLARFKATTEQLEAALESRDVIGQAKGILMQREGITDEQAFGMLRKASQETNLKLRDIAARIVKEAAVRPGTS